MSLFRIAIEAETDWFETIILDDNANWVLGTVFALNSRVDDPIAPAVNFQMDSLVIGFGKSRAWDRNKTTISVCVETPNTTLSFNSRKGAAGPVRYTSYGPNPGDPAVDYRVHDLNVDPQPLRIALTGTRKAELDAEAEKAARNFDPKAVQIKLSTIRPSDDPGPSPSLGPSGPRRSCRASVYRVAVVANFFTMASSNLRSLSFRFDE